MPTNNSINAPFPFSPTIGGTGVNNGSSTITVGGNFAFAGAYSFTGTLTGATAVTFPTSGTLATSADVVAPINHTTATATLISNTRNIVNVPAALFTGTLPATSAVGDIIEIIGNSADGWQVAQSAGQQIIFGDVATTLGATGYLQSTLPADQCYLVCVVANTTWTASVSGNVDYN